MLSRLWLIFGSQLAVLVLTVLSSPSPFNENSDQLMVHKRRTKKSTISLSSSSTLQTTSTSAAKATLTKASKCTKVSPTGTPLLAAFSTDTPDGSAFLGYVAPKGSAAKLSAVSILNGTTNQTYLILPNRAATNFDFVTPEGLIFSVDNKLLVKNKPLQSCSDPPSAVPARKRDIGNEIEERQVIGPLKGGATVAIDVSNHCGQPVTGLSPSPGAGTLHLLFTCDLAPYQYLGFHVPGVTPPYKYGRLAEPSPGHYIGYCPYPPFVDLSKQALCINGIAATNAFCDVIDPSVPMPYSTGLDPKVACLGLIRIPEVGVVLAGICESALITAIGFCKVFGKDAIQNALCGPPPSSAVMNTVVTDLDIGYALGDQVTILPDGPPVPVILGPYEEDYLPCTSSTRTSTSSTRTSTSSTSTSSSSSSSTTTTSPTTTPTSSVPPTPPPPPPPTSTAPNPPPPSRDPACIPQTLNGGFEGGYPSNPANGFQGYNFDNGCCPTWGIDCYSSRGFAAAEGRCYAYIYPVLSVPIAAPGGPFPPQYSTNIGIFQNINLASSCLGQTYSFSVSVRMQPNTGSTCGVQVLQFVSGSRSADGAVTYSLSTGGWSTVSWSFSSMDPYPSSTNVELNFFCTVIGPNGAPWIAFDGWSVS